MNSHFIHPNYASCSQPYYGYGYPTASATLIPYGAYSQNYMPTPPTSPATNLAALTTTANANQQIYLTDTNNNQGLEHMPLYSESRLHRHDSYSSENATNTASTTPDIVGVSSIVPVFNASLKHNIPTTISPSTNTIPNLDLDALARLMPSRKYMTRKFPQKKRTAKEQERRNKNTETVRLSRAKEKIKLMVIEKEIFFSKQQNFELFKEIIPMAGYLEELLKLGATFEPDQRNEHVKKVGKILGHEYLANMPIQPNRKRDFSIAFLLGLE